MTIVFVRANQEAANIQSFYFKPERPVRYTPGQYAEFTLKHPRTDERGPSRYFTLASSPTDEFICITTKRSPDRSSSFKKTLWALEPGDQLHMSEPQGDFVLPKLIQTPLVFVAAGIGITPYHSIVRWLHDTGESRTIQLLYGVRSEEEIIFQTSFEKAGVHPTIVVSHPTPAWGGERGQISAELILGLERPSEDTLMYISGPEAMIEALAKDLKKAGVARHQLVLDFFPNYTEV